VDREAGEAAALAAARQALSLDRYDKVSQALLTRLESG
jgi:predicted HicB family RNase H-like nuclease